MEQIINDSNNELGIVKISEEVVAIIAGLATTEVEGVAGMSGGFVNGIAEKMGMKNMTKGVKVSVGEVEAAVDLFIIVQYGIRIPEVAWNIQENVKKAIETMTGLKVVEVNINIQGVEFNKEEKEEKEVDTDKVEKAEKVEKINRVK